MKVETGFPIPLFVRKFNGARHLHLFDRLSLFIDIKKESIEYASIDSELWPRFLICSLTELHMDPSEHLKTSTWVSVRNSVADPGFTRHGAAPTPDLVSKSYYLARFWQKTTWKWKKLDRGGTSLVSLLDPAMELHRVYEEPSSVVDLGFPRWQGRQLQRWSANVCHWTRTINSMPTDKCARTQLDRKKSLCQIKIHCHGRIQDSSYWVRIF